MAFQTYESIHLDQQVRMQTQDMKLSLNCALHAGPVLFSPYCDLTIMMASPFIEKKYALALNRIFSLHYAFKYASFMPTLSMSTPLSASIRRDTWTKSIETIGAYVALAGGSILCPPATKHSFLMNSIFTSNII